MNNLSEEEMIESVKYHILLEYQGFCNIDKISLQGLLDLYKKQKERIQELEENDYAWHQLLRMENEREYRSKFLKDFRKENGENIMPDYDEIYKRYDKQKRMIEMMAEKLTTPTNEKDWVIKYFEEKVEVENE